MEMSAVVSTCKVLGSVRTSNLSDTNRLIFVGAVVVGEKLSMKASQSKHENSTPWWKCRLEGQIKDLRKDLSRIEHMNKGLKPVDTIGKRQRPVFSLGVSQHMHKITNL